MTATELGHDGHKNGKGFFEHSEDIIARMMLPMASEMAHCAEEGVVDTPAEADLALLFGVGFPPFRGGIFRWMDTLGMAHLAEASAKFAHLGKAYELTERMREMLATGETYY